MGTSIPDIIPPDDVVAGAACGNCWGIGQPFGDGDTPASIRVTVSGINKGPTWFAGDGEPVEGEFELTQDPLASCEYIGTFAGDLFVYGFLAGDTQSSIFRPGIGFVFNTTPNPACSLFLLSTLNAKFTGGSMLVTWGEIL